jgi:hypothetical protein
MLMVAGEGGGAEAILLGQRNLRDASQEFILDVVTFWVIADGASG